MYTIVVFQDPLPLEKCIIYCEPEWEDFFEVHEFVGKENFVFKVRTEDDKQITHSTKYLMLSYEII